MSPTELIVNAPFRATLAQKITAVGDWYDLAKSDEHETEVGVQQLGQVLVDKGLVPDVDTALKTMHRLLNSHDRIHSMTLAVFQRIFVRSIFKESLIETISEIKKQSANPGDSLEASIGEYKRKSMLGGVEAIKVFTNLIMVADKRERKLR